MQYFKNGLEVVAKNLKCLLNKINVVMFQLIKKMPVAPPVMAALNQLTFPKYSGARNNESTPNAFIKLPDIAPITMNQNKSSTWYLRKCSNTSCMGSERYIPMKISFIRGSYVFPVQRKNTILTRFEIKNEICLLYYVPSVFSMYLCGKIFAPHRNTGK